jgi:hypothetical protein
MKMLSKHRPFCHICKRDFNIGWEMRLDSCINQHSPEKTEPVEEESLEIR